MVATPETAPAPWELLQDLLNELDEKGSVMPIFEGVAADFKGVAAGFGFLLDDNLFDVGMRADGQARVFSSSATMREAGLGRHISVFWELRMELDPARFGSSALGICLCESGEPHGIRHVLGLAMDTWWADMTAGWSQAHAVGLAEHLKAQWAPAQTGTTRGHQRALKRLEAVLAC